MFMSIGTDGLMRSPKHNIAPNNAVQIYLAKYMGIRAEQIQRGDSEITMGFLLNCKC